MPYGILPANVVKAWPGLSFSAKAVAGAFAFVMDASGKSCLDLQALKVRAGLKSVDSVSKATKELCEMKLLKKSRGRRINAGYAWTGRVSKANPAKPRCQEKQGNGVLDTKKNTGLDTGVFHGSLVISQESLIQPVSTKVLKVLKELKKKLPKKKTSVSADQIAQGVQLVLSEYADLIPPRIDTTRARAKKHLLNLLKRHPAQTLVRSVQNYRAECEQAETGPQYRRRSGNFFGQDADWESYADPDWTISAPQDNQPKQGAWSQDEIDEMYKLEEKLKGNK